MSGAYHFPLETALAIGTKDRQGLFERVLLLVEDDDEDARAAVRSLRSLGLADVVAVRTAAAARAIVARRASTIDVALVDLALPDDVGTNLMNEFASGTPVLCSVPCTGTVHGDSGGVASLGGMSLLAKPLETDRAYPALVLAAEMTCLARSIAGATAGAGVGLGTLLERALRDVITHTPSLTPTEVLVLRLHAEGRTKGHIAASLEKSGLTIASHIRSIRAKLAIRRDENLHAFLLRSMSSALE